MIYAGVPHVFRNTHLNDYVIEGRYGDRTALKAAVDFVENYEERLEHAEGQVYIGRGGEGKTMLVSAIVNELRDLGTEAHFVALSTYMRAIQRLFALDKAGQVDEWADLDHYVASLRNRVPLLVVDDVGKEYRAASGFAVDEFDYLLRRRHHNGLTTIMTSNVPLSTWGDVYGPAAESFVYEICGDIIVMECPDFRRKGWE